MPGSSQQLNVHVWQGWDHHPVMLQPFFSSLRQLCTFNSMNQLHVQVNFAHGRHQGNVFNQHLSVKFFKLKKHIQPKPLQTKTSFFCSSYSYIDPTWWVISNYEIKKIYQIYPNAAIFSNLDVAEFVDSVCINEGHYAQSSTIQGQDYGSCWKLETVVVSCCIKLETDSDTENDETCMSEQLRSFWLNTQQL